MTDPRPGAPGSPPESLGRHPKPGDVVGGYRIEEHVGAGGMATVFRATDDRGAVVALKVLNPARVLPEDVKRFTREYKALSRMDHHNVVSVYKAGVAHGYPWIAMEYVDGTDLGTLLEMWKAAPPADRFARVEHLLRGLCKGLQYIHDLGMIHRDIKPTNVLVTRGGDPKLTDFGVVKGDDSDSTHHTQLTMAGRLVGTVAFMAPELITDEGVDRRADLYALGAVLYMMLTWRRPIEAKSVAGYLARHLTEVPRPAGELDPTVPRRLERIAQRLLVKDRTYRYPTAQAVLQALDRREDDEPPPLRGRESELSRWSQVLLGLVDGVGGALAVHAPAGGGKTRLLGAFLDQVDTDGVRILRAEARRGRVLEQLAGARSGRGTEVVGGGSHAALASRVKGHTAIVAVDDLDLADPAEIDALARLLREQVAIEAEPLLLLFTATDLSRLFVLVSGEATGLASEQLELGPLDARSTIAVLRDRGIAGPAAPILGRRLHADYAGTPGPMIQQLEAMQAAGWLEEVGDTWRPVRSLDALRKDDLPVPAQVESTLRERLDELDARATQLVELLAVIDRPAPAALLERCATELPSSPGATGSPVDSRAAGSGRGSASEVARLIDALVQQQVFLRATDQQQEVLRLTHPCAARVVRARMTPELRRQHHRAVADAMSARRRRESALEVAYHREMAGDPEAAYPLYVTAARRAARQAAFADVIDITQRATAIREAAEPSLPQAQRVQLRRWLWLLEGEALLARGAWKEAHAALEQAVEAAREEGDSQVVARCLASLGRAYYRRSRYAEAAPLLEEALTHDGEPSDRLPALRALADIRLRSGDLDGGERLWNEALALAVDSGSRDAEARARRGLAHLRGIQGLLQESGELLDQAEELLATDGDARVRAGVLARSIEIDTAAGRYGSALGKAEILVDLARRRDLSERLPEAYALLGEALLAVGDTGEALDAAQQCLVFAKAHGARTWDARLRAARTLCDLGEWDEVDVALPSPEDLPTHKIDDPAAQLAAIRARSYAHNHPVRSRDLAAWALTREPALMALRAARIALDAAQALTSTGQSTSARNAVKRGLKVLQGPGADGMRLELLLAMQAASPDDRVLLAAGQVARRIASGLSPQLARSFCSRPAVAEALARLGAR